MTTPSALALLPAALLLDALLGDPRAWPHPVRAMGALAAFIEPPLRRSLPPLLAGAVGWFVVIGVFYSAALAALGLASLVAGAWGAWLISVYLVYVSLAPRDLAEHALRVYRGLGGPLRAKGAGPATKGEALAAGRAAVAMMVGRDVEDLDEAGVIKATIESVAESTIDGVVAPLLWALLLGPAGALAYRAANTLDSLWGHRDKAYLLYGRVAARADDVLNWLPARLGFFASLLACLLLAPLSAGRLNASRLLRLGWRDRRAHESPNAAWLEAAFAGALGIGLGGPSSYGGLLHDKPSLGVALRPVEVADIPRALLLMYGTTLVFLSLALLARWAAGWLGLAA